MKIKGDEDFMGFVKRFIFVSIVNKPVINFIFNCDEEWGEIFSTLKEKEIINVGVSKDKGGEFTGQVWLDVIPFEVSESPHILYSGKYEEFVQSPFTQEELKIICNFIKRNKEPIQQYWIGEIDFLELDKKLKYTVNYELH